MRVKSSENFLPLTSILSRKGERKNVTSKEIEMSILVVGSVAFDSVKTPFGMVDNALGGSGTYFSVSASYFTKVKLVAVVGKDFPQKHIALLKKHHIDLEGLKQTEGKTFRWKGQYIKDLNQAETLDTQLNVFASFKPEIPDSYKDSEFVFLANIDPVLQLDVLRQVKRPKLVACDTMNYWITGKKPELKKTLAKVDILIINDAELRLLAEENNMVKAAKKVLSWGPSSLVIKRGEYGVLYIGKNEMFVLPALPLEKVCDPTGAGDTFAGGFMGALAKAGKITNSSIRKAIVYGSVMASYNIEDFSLNRLKSLTQADISKRYAQFKRLTSF
jgi:sugar/nucleoside kinase (ribokinase family)